MEGKEMTHAQPLSKQSTMDPRPSTTKTVRLPTPEPRHPRGYSSTNHDNRQTCTYNVVLNEGCVSGQVGLVCPSSMNAYRPCMAKKSDGSLHVQWRKAECEEWRSLHIDESKQHCAPRYWSFWDQSQCLQEGCPETWPRITRMGISLDAVDARRKWVPVHEKTCVHHLIQ